MERSLKILISSDNVGGSAVPNDFINLSCGK